MFKTKSLLISGISLLITIVMMVTLCSVGFTVSAGETIDAWDGQAAESFAEGSGDGSSPDKAILIENAAQLYKMVKDYGQTQTPTYTYFKIIADIYINNVTADDLVNPTTDAWTAKGFHMWPSHSYGKNGFAGEIDGGGHTVYGLYTFSTYGGILPSVVGEAKIYNLNIKDSFIYGKCVGGIVGTAYGSNAKLEVSNCIAENIVVETGTGNYKGVRAAGIVGGGESTPKNITVKNCAVIGTTTKSNHGTYPNVHAGILGYIGANAKEGNHSVISCFTDDKIHPVSAGTTSDKSGSNYVFDLVGNNITYTNVYTAADCPIAKDGVIKVANNDAMKGTAAKENMPNLDWTVWYTTENGYPTLTAPEAPACDHTNKETTDNVTKAATYFTTGLKDVVCECGETVEEDVVIPYDTATPVTFDDAVLDPETNKLTVAWTYSEALNEDIKAAATKGLAVKFAFGDKEYTVPNTVLNTEGGSVTIEG
ncbi:MAG: hypothetical protein J6B80_08260, partial [Clostridia bacterium]|nr:hypothetical protein [Clostridia bacterium]